jgi:3-carboxy-cis,cis-muconate cycloisomerase
MGGSSTMPHKRNPVDSALAVACAEQARASASTLASAVVQEHERGLGGGQAEWGALSQALVATGGAAAHVRAVLDGLEVDVGRMRTNLIELTAAEHASFVLAERVGRERAHELVADAARSESFRDGLLVAGLSAGEVERVLDPETYLGAADALVDRALAFYREEP